MEAAVDGRGAAAGMLRADRACIRRALQELAAGVGDSVLAQGKQLPSADLPAVGMQQRQ
jgi:hypothetical protein